MPETKSGGDEEIAIGAGSFNAAADGEPSSVDGSGGDDMGCHPVNLEGLVGPSASNDELIDAILQLPAERLIPWELCHLPSRGLYYGWSSQTVEVHAMGQTAEKILATQRLAETGQAIDYLFRECVRYPDPSFDTMDLLVGDRVFLLYYLRGITHGNIYEFAVTCRRPECNQVSTHTYDLNNLSSPGQINWANPSLGQEPFKVTLPYISQCTGRDVWVGVRFLRGRDINSMVAMRKTKKRMFASSAVRVGGNKPQRREQENIKIDDTLTENLQMVIVSLMGSTDRSKINQFVQRMHASDTAAIREWLRTNSPGIETMITLKCPECSQEFSVELPVTESFFRPTPKHGDG